MLRCDVSGDPNFIQLPPRNRETTLDPHSNSTQPFEAMMKHLRLEWDL